MGENTESDRTHALPSRSSSPAVMIRVCLTQWEGDMVCCSHALHRGTPNLAGAGGERGQRKAPRDAFSFSNLLIINFI